jgi:hypothetical protein
MATHTSNIAALNALVISLGGNGGHRFNIDALNEWATLLGGEGGHTTNITALNEIAVLSGGAGGHRFNIDALSSIASELEASGGPYSFNLQALNQIIEVAGEGGDGAPEWVPEGADTHVDLLGGQAWNGGEVPITNVLGEDTELESGWGELAFLPENMQEGGYASNSGYCGFVGDSKAKLIAGATTLIEVTLPSDGSGLYFAFGSADGSAAVDMQVDCIAFGAIAGVSLSSWTGTLSESNLGGEFIVPGGVNRIAFTASPTRLEIALNGHLIFSTVLDATEWPPTLAGAVFGTSEGTFVRGITIYDILSDTTGLAELSAL